MYEYIDGKITAITPFYIILENNKIGYKLYVANPFRYQLEKNLKIYIYQAVRENDITLYGFFDKDEKELFLKLISVSGIGPKSALAILANGKHESFIAAINAEDINYLVKFPGIGKKTAKQIILDLKDKLENSFIKVEENENINVTSSFFDESILALLALGYTKTEVRKIEKRLKNFSANSTDEYLREGLRLLLGK